MLLNNKWHEKKNPFDFDVFIGIFFGLQDLMRGLYCLLYGGNTT